MDGIDWLSLLQSLHRYMFNFLVQKEVQLYIYKALQEILYKVLDLLLHIV